MYLEEQINEFNMRKLEGFLISLLNNIRENILFSIVRIHLKAECQQRD